MCREGSDGRKMCFGCGHLGQEVDFKVELRGAHVNAVWCDVFMSNTEN